MKKTFCNTPKGRRELPTRSGAYNLNSKKGDIIYSGHTNNLNRRIKEHHANKKLRFSSIFITPTKTKEQAKKIELIRLKTFMPEKNRSNH